MYGTGSTSGNFSSASDSHRRFFAIHSGEDKGEGFNFLQTGGGVGLAAAGIGAGLGFFAHGLGSYEKNHKDAELAALEKSKRIDDMAINRIRTTAPVERRDDAISPDELSKIRVEIEGEIKKSNEQSSKCLVM